MPLFTNATTLKVIDAVAIVLSEAYRLARCRISSSGSRPHLSLDRNAPVPRQIEPADCGKVISIPHLGGLHHRYTRAA